MVQVLHYRSAEMDVFSVLFKLLNLYAEITAGREEKIFWFVLSGFLLVALVSIVKNKSSFLGVKLFIVSGLLVSFGCTVLIFLTYL